MRTRPSIVAAVALCLIVPALAQDASAPPAVTEAPPATAAYPIRQDTSQWLGSNLIGATVVSASNQKSVGRIANLVVNETGAIQAALISVGGVFGFGAKDVAVTYDSMSIVRTAKGDAIDHVTIAATKDDLLRAVAFKSLKRQMAEAQPKRD